MHHGFMTKVALETHQTNMQVKGLKSMSFVRYVSLPKEANLLHAFGTNGIKEAFHISDFHNKTQYPHISLCLSSMQGMGSIGFTVEEKAVFNNCFTNEFVYNFTMTLPEEHMNRRLAISYSNLDSMEKKHEFRKMDEFSDTFYSQLLYDCFSVNLEIGEFVEIYKDWTNHNDFTFGPPVSEKTINLCDLLTNSKHLHMVEKQKLTIVRES